MSAREVGVRCDEELVGAWLKAAADPQVRAAIAAVHATIEQEVLMQAPRCEQSGRCCHFDAYGHRLYVTGLEAAATLQGVGAIAKCIDGGVIADFTTLPGCPFQINHLCGAHAHRPAGCRVYFCDPAWSSRMNDVAENAVAEVRAIHERFAIPYRYMEWRALLTMFPVDVMNMNNRSAAVAATVRGRPVSE